MIRSTRDRPLITFSWKGLVHNEYRESKEVPLVWKTTYCLRSERKIRQLNRKQGEHTSFSRVERSLLHT